MKIYAIRHSSGEWDDYRSWINERCFSSKEKADEFKDEYNDSLKDRVEEERIKDEKCSDLQDSELCNLGCDTCKYKSEYWIVSEEYDCSIVELELDE